MNPKAPPDIANYGYPGKRSSRHAKRRERRQHLSNQPMEEAPWGMLIFQDVCLQVNREACRLYARPRHEFLHLHPLLLAPEVQVCGTPSQLLAESYCQSTREGETVSFSWRALRKDGIPFDAEITLSPMILSDGSNAILMCLRDTSRERSNQERLRLLSRAVEQVNAIVFITDVRGTIEYVNTTFTEVTGYRFSDVRGRNARILGKGDNPSELFANLWERLEAGLSWSGAVKNRKRNSEPFWMETTITPIRNERGEIEHHLAVATDITRQKLLEDERLRLQKQLEQAHKMEALGTLAGGVAHDFNNVLAAIHGFATLAAKDLPKDSHAGQCLEKLMGTALRARDLVRQILAFSRPDEGKTTVIRLDQCIREAVDFLRHTLPSCIQVQMDIPDLPLYTEADPTKIHQVVFNLASNAEHAMRPHGGSLTFQVRAVHLDAKLAERYFKLRLGPYLRFTVLDSGHGMSAETIQRIFDPFFTTKPAGEGTGLGLSVVHGIVDQMQGQITVYSELGKGTAFNLLIPIRAAPTEALLPLVSQLRRGTERILLVDDQEEVAATQAQLLRDLGYRVTMCLDPECALEQLRQDPLVYDLLITDQDMPRINGLELARRIKEIRRDLPILLTSGFSQNLQASRLAEMGIAKALLKPVFIHDLSQAMAEVLPPVEPRRLDGTSPA